MLSSCGLAKFVTIVSRQTRLQLARHFCAEKSPDQPSSSDQDQFEKKHFFNRSENETIDTKRARLLYQSRKRGMLENDLLLATFAKKYLNTMSPKELEMYDKMINTVSNEWDLYHWAVGKKEIPEEYRNSIMDKYCQHVRNIEREKRLRQPDL